MTCIKKFLVATALVLVVLASKEHTFASDNYACIVKTTPIKSATDSQASTYGFLTKGKVIRYEKKVGNYLQIDYRGKNAYIDRNALVTGKKLENYVRQHPSLFDKKATVTKQCRMWDGNTAQSKVVAIAKKGTEFKVIGVIGNTVKVAYDGQSYYVNEAYVKLNFMLDVTAFPVMKTTGTKREKIVDFALQFVGNPYVWGGESLTSGADCSGYVKSVLKEFGITVPRVSYQQAEYGKKVSLQDLQPGDLVFYMRGKRIGHVAMYIGNGKIVHARGKDYGIVVTDIDYNGNTPAWARSVIS